MPLFPLSAARAARRALVPALLVFAGLAQAQAQAPAAAGGSQRLRIVGGLAGVNQYTRHEEPFWTRELPRLSNGRLSAEIVPFDQAGLRGSEMLRLIQLGAVPFGYALLTMAASLDPELSAADLVGLNPDFASIKRHLAAFRPHLERRLRERWGIETLAIYVYPAQVTWCNKPFATLAELAGRRIRTAGVAQSDLVEAMGARPVVMPFAEIVPHMRNGTIDCAITGTMSGNTIGLHELTTHVHTLAASWGLGLFGANQAAWNALPADLRNLLRQELARLEAAVWRDAEAETGEGQLCNTGASGCVNGRKGRMQLVTASPEDSRRWRELFVSTVLPRWVQRCGPPCAAAWNDNLRPATGIQAPTAGR